MTIFDIHRELVEAISRGNAEAAENLARNHNTQPMASMVAILEVEGENAG